MEHKTLEEMLFAVGCLSQWSHRRHPAITI